MHINHCNTTDILRSKRYRLLESDFLITHLKGTAHQKTELIYLSNKWERRSAVVECLTRDLRAAGFSVTGVTALCPWARHINPCLVMVKPRKTRSDETERLGRKESNQTNKQFNNYALTLTRSGQYRRHICELMTSDPPYKTWKNQWNQIWKKIITFWFGWLL